MTQYRPCPSDLSDVHWELIWARYPLCTEVGRPAVWPLGEFAGRERYRTLLVFKRPLTGGV
jgi:hypothetical protein